MKYSKWIGVASAVLLIIASFLPWTYHPDLEKAFTGFYSQNNVYGKPGKVLIFIAVIGIIFYLIPRIWAKRWNLFFTAFALAYAVKSYILFTGCYRGICPEKMYGIFLVMIASIGMLVAAVFPDMSLPQSKEKSAAAGSERSI